MSHAFNSQTKPRLRPGVLLAPADQGNWQLRWDFDELTFLDGDACREVLPWLSTRMDGARTVAELLALPDCPCAQQHLNEVLEQLFEQGHVIDAAQNDVGDLNSVGSAHIVVVGRSSLARFVLNALKQQGFDRAGQCEEWRLEPSGLIDVTGVHSDKSLAIVVQHDFTTAELEELNERANTAGSSWMLVGAWNRRVLVGPILMPGQTACYQCYQSRLDSHRQHLAAHRALQAWRSTHAAPPSDAASPEATLPAINMIAAAWTALESVAFFSQTRPLRTLGRVIVYDPESCKLTTERVLRLPWCPRCSAYESGKGNNQSALRPAAVSK